MSARRPNLPRRSISVPRRLSNASATAESLEEEVVNNAAFRRSVSSPYSGGAPFIFRTPDVLPVHFEAELLFEVRRLAEWLRGELQDLQAVHHSAPVIEPLRLIVASNEDEALKAVRDYAVTGEDPSLEAKVKAAFVEQDLLLAAWSKEAKLGAGAGAAEAGQASDFAEPSGGEYVWRVLMLGGIFLALVHVAHTIPDSSVRCFLLIVSILTLQLSGVVPQYCIGLLVPVFSTALRVLPGFTIAETAHLCFGAMMNQMTALVIGSFTINAVFLRCQLEVRFIDAISDKFGQMPKTSLLMLMLGCMLASSVTFVTLLALSAMLPVCLSCQNSGGKGLLLGVGIACTLGGALMPLSGATSLIVLSALTKFGLTVDFFTWVMVALPLMTAIVVFAWFMLLLVFGTPPTLEKTPTHLQRLKASHYFFIGCSLLFILGCAAEEHLQPWIGSSGNLGLMLTALSFGSGFLTRADFAAMPWEVLMILFGVNVTAFVLKESGLALSLASMLIPVQVYNVWLWLEIGKITAVSLLIASLTGQTVYATLAIPVVVALGAKLYCPVLTSLLATMAIHCGCFLPQASTDLILTFEMSGREDKPEKRRLLTRADFFGVGLVVGVVAWLLIMTVGYWASIGLLGVPPNPIIIKEPTELIPSIIWLGNETTADEKLKILERQMEREAVNATLDKVAKDEGLRPIGSGEGGNITVGRAQAPHPITAKYSTGPLSRFVAWVRHRRHHNSRHMLNKRLRRRTEEESS